MTSRGKDFKDLMSERQEIFAEIEELLGKDPSEERDRKLVELLEKNRDARNDIESLLSSISNKLETEEQREYYRTMVDFLRLVDADKEIELLQRVKESLAKSTGELKRKSSWIEEELERSRRLVSEE